MLTQKEFDALVEYQANKPTLLAKSFLRYIKNNYVEETVTEEPKKKNAAAEAAKAVRKGDTYIHNPNRTGYTQTDDGKRGVHIRTQVDSEIADEARKHYRRST